MRFCSVDCILRGKCWRNKSKTHFLHVFANIFIIAETSYKSTFIILQIVLQLHPTYTCQSPHRPPCQPPWPAPQSPPLTSSPKVSSIARVSSVKSSSISFRSCCKHTSEEISAFNFHFRITHPKSSHTYETFSNIIKYPEWILIKNIYLKAAFSSSIVNSAQRASSGSGESSPGETRFQVIHVNWNICIGLRKIYEFIFKVSRSFSHLHWSTLR